MFPHGHPLIIATAVAVALSFSTPAALAATYSVPVDYPTISAAIANASAGDTVSVASGTYHENVVIDKTISLIGRDTGGSMPTIAVTSGTGITVAADSVVVQRLRVQGGATGILVRDCGLVNVMECIVVGNGYGITVSGAHGCAVMNNTVSGNSNIGIYILNSNGCPVYLNEVKGNQYGISLAGTSSLCSAYMNALESNGGGNGLANGYVNSWNSSIPLSYGYGGKQFSGYLGNYWDNLGGTDSNGDGIVDTAVLLAENNGDHAPLVAPIPERPAADFTSDSTGGPVPLPIQFTDASVGYPVSWLWDFGDGTASNTQNPAHIYQNKGSYTVTLTVNNVRGEGQIVRSNYIVAGTTATPTPTATASPTATPEPWPTSTPTPAATATPPGSPTPTATPKPSPGMGWLAALAATAAACALAQRES
ncbi:MAG TPA: PKD domain-containing protein [Methanocella sp.]|uniref:PKD domain-containing protein n=1 Tax=Methanocella sp. TaxID=2052833 RepID=UPI002C9BC4EA|nr:PKD domain-containing protein [Methanocella sp.]HTY91729.1 PKD domain-containing protein [Methanocella sp.]